MREVNTEEIRKTVKDLFLKINYDIGSDVIAALKKGLETEESETGRAVLEQILKNNKIATDEQIAICQDTGFSIIFVKLGQDVRLTGGDFNDAINQGVREAYEEGYLRKSVVDDPLFDRTNTKDNTPAIVHLEIVPGDKIHIEVTAKGGGSENMSAMKVLTPSQGEQGVRDFVVDAVKNAGPNPCPPIVGGVYPAAVQKFQVEPNEFNREKEYIEYNIDATRYAYGLEDVKPITVVDDGELVVGERYWGGKLSKTVWSFRLLTSGFRLLLFRLVVGGWKRPVSREQGSCHRSLLLAISRVADLSL
jgi:hypothetical protein